VALRLEDVAYNPDQETPSGDGGVSVSIRSDIKRFYEEQERLYAEPFAMRVMSSTGGEGTGNEATDTVKSLVVLDGSEEMKPFFDSREASLRAGTESLFQSYERLGLTPDFDPVRVRRASIEIRDAHLQTNVRHDLVSVLNTVTGVDILRFDASQAGEMATLKERGPYGDRALYPNDERTYMVECRGFSGATQAVTTSPDDLLDLFKADLILREVEVTKPTGLVMGDDWQGVPRANVLEAQQDGIWQGGVVVPGSSVPEGVHRFMQEGERIVAQFVAPSGKPIRISRRYNGDVQVLVEREPGKWIAGTVLMDDQARVTGEIQYPTGEVLPGGFFVNGMLQLGNAQALSGQISFMGGIRTNGDFHFEGECVITVLQKTVGEARFIIDRRDGLYVMGKIDAGIASVFIEGRLSSTTFSLTGALDARVGGLLGVKASLTITPSMFKMTGDVFIAGRKIFHGMIYVSGSQFTFQWSASCGRVGASASLTFRSTKNSKGQVISWYVGVDLRVWIKLPWPFGKFSLGLGCSISSDGWLSVRLGPVTIKINIVKFDIDWEWF